VVGLGGVGVGVWLILREDSEEVKKPEKTVDAALEKLNSSDVTTRREGLEWLAEIEPDEARGKEVFEAITKAARQDLDPQGQTLVKKAVEKWGKALVAFGGKDPLGGGQPSLLSNDKPAKERTTEELLTLLNADGTPGNVRKDVMNELASRKEAKAAPGMAKQLTNFFERGAAVDALRALGPVAEKDVLGYMHHNDGGVAEAARGLLDGYQTKLEVKLEQTAKDLDSSDGNRRRVALEWLGRIRPGKLPPQAAELAQGLEKMLSDPFQKENAMRALVGWGSKANVPAVAKALESSAFFGGFEQLGVQFLVKYPDAQGVAAVMHHINNGSPDIEKALRGLGPVAEGEVVKYLHDPDGRKRDMARRLLKGYGTKEDVLLVQTVEDLRSADNNRRNNAAQWLAVTPKPASSPQAAAVAKGLEAALGMLGPFDKRETYTQALVGWATKDTVPTLIRLLVEDLQDKGNSKFPHAPEAITALGALKDERAVDVLIAQLAKHTNDATNALKAMGPMAERKVLGLLGNRVAAVRLVGCDILKDIGTKDSVESLKKLSKLDRVPAVKNAAKDALDAINLRGGVKQPDK
jgi:HEAT repeat protein